MAQIHVYNIHNEDHSSEEYCWYCGRSKNGNVLGNPFTHNGKHSSLAKLSFKTREQAIEAYERYFDVMYGKDEIFTREIDKIYAAYKGGHDVYLGCFCKPLPCHADVIAKKLQKRLILEGKPKKSE